MTEGVRRLITGLLLAGLLGPAASRVAAQGLDEGVRRVLSAVVGVVAHAPASARTAGVLGTTRAGSGIVIDASGLVLTIGYLIVEAAEVEIRIGDGRTVAAEILGYDADSGFGLLRSTEPLDAQPMGFGDSALLAESSPVLVTSFAEPRNVTPALVVDVREFAGYWEYLIDDAIITSPPHPFFGGAALIGSRGELLGVGSLSLQHTIRGRHVVPSNLFVPINLVKPILADMLTGGRSSSPPRPWLGVYVQEVEGQLLVIRLASEGPGESAGVSVGDVLVAINGEPVASLPDFYRKLWATGAAGVAVDLQVQRDRRRLDLTVTSIDRYDWYR